ncbi:class I SAM-dependent methyltransferase [Pseudomonas sp. LPH60]|uniref:class I SAM-dependent methyltransferase n=1 Tax=Pseudomonas sp. LPH60 TaxID=3065906 RepID=UPI00273CE52D|nr:class I SAM-dependent methyltransferase [Pseudomonas sp. LPH60]MDP4572998.1 class I SAM-dependent methyltransferase [Pseudomonas sp. LPH60]
MTTAINKFLFNSTLTKIGNALPAPLKDCVKSLIRVPRRRAFAMTYYKTPLKLVDEWASKYSEDTNFYYKLTKSNRNHLAHLLAHLTGKPLGEITNYFDELEDDNELRTHIERGVKESGYGSDIVVNYGRRIGWYAFARLMKPKVIVETGVDHGVGSCILASALLRNAQEGFPGKYYGTDINPWAGKLLEGKYATVGQILYGDSIESLRKMAEPIDIFINDSDHSADYEYNEYRTVEHLLSPHSVILGDNAHVSDSLSTFAEETGRPFIFFAEKPADHWYPGAGIGISISG